MPNASSIGKVAPPSDTLRQKQPRYYAVGNYSEILLAHLATHKCRKITQNNAAVNAQSAASEIEKGGPPRHHVRFVPWENVHVHSRTQNAYGDYHQGIDCNVVGIVTTFLKYKPPIRIANAIPVTMNRA